MAETTRNPVQGDVIWADRMARGAPYNHCGIYIGNGRVIHFAAPEGSEISQENAVIHETSFESFKDGCPVKVIDFPNGKPPDETIERAFSRLGEKGYDFTANNCDHFATWCKTGEHRSLQVDKVKNTIRSILRDSPVGGFAAELVCTVHDVAEAFKALHLSGIGCTESIVEKLDLNTDISDSYVPAEDEYAVEEIPDNAALDDDEYPELPKEFSEDDENPQGKMPQSKIEKIDIIADKIKKTAFFVAGVLEMIKYKLPPRFHKLSYKQIAANVANIIDKITIGFKLVAGIFKVAKARDEIRTANTALLGKTVREKQTMPVTEAVKAAFGKAGAVVKLVVHAVVFRVAPQSLRLAIKSGFQKLGGYIANRLRSGAKMTTGIFTKLKQTLHA
ncbi:MAG: lecithin retinol acyltransferase family protein [Treponema sp.]|jgi:hypothetical protein|nr:lecithin retinol acyltransferase family protein [Treponema sp.]